MEKLSITARDILIERFSKDNIIALATSNNNIPFVRSVNAYYDEKAFYIITYALSSKMEQIKNNPICAISADWFTATGTGINLGWYNKPENSDIAKKLRIAFKEWIDNGHNNFSDTNCIILKVELKKGVLFSHGTKYDIDFTD